MHTLKTETLSYITILQNPYTIKFKFKFNYFFYSQLYSYFVQFMSDLRS